MSEQITNLFNFLQSAAVKRKYALYTKNGGKYTDEHIKNRKGVLRSDSAEADDIYMDYIGGMPIVGLSAKYRRTVECIESFLKRRKAKNKKLKKK